MARGSSQYRIEFQNAFPHSFVRSRVKCYRAFFLKWRYCFGIDKKNPSTTKSFLYTLAYPNSKLFRFSKNKSFRITIYSTF